MRRMRPVFFVLGGLLLVGSLLGASLLATGSATEQQPKTAAPTNGKNGTGPVVIGYVDADKGLIRIGLPPVLQSGRVEGLAKDIHEGAEVKEGQELFSFDASTYKGKLESAKAAVKLAETKVEQAKVAGQKREQEIKAQEEAVAAAKEKVRLADEAWKFYARVKREEYKTQNRPEADWDKLLAADPKNFELQLAHVARQRELEVENVRLNALRMVDPTKALLAEAQAGVEVVKAQQREAEDAVRQCTVRAKVAGTIEQINIGPGDTIGPTATTPAMILVPAGPRVVRAEIEAEFAHRIGTDKIDKVVTIYDNSDSKITYRGTVRRVSGSFLAKRNAGGPAGLMAANETRVLEAVIEVADPNPPGQPPLRVGQKVRVNFGQ